MDHTRKYQNGDHMVYYAFETTQNVFENIYFQNK